VFVLVTLLTSRYRLTVYMANRGAGTDRTGLGSLCKALSASRNRSLIS
jgi:hypothetical protein